MELYASVPSCDECDEIGNLGIGDGTGIDQITLGKLASLSICCFRGTRNSDPSVAPPQQ